MRRKGKFTVAVCFICLFVLVLNTGGCSNNEGNGGPSQTALTSAAADNTPETDTDGLPAGTVAPDASGLESGVVPIAKIDKPDFSTRKEQKYVQTEWKPVQYQKKVAPYKVKSDLSNIENLKQFGGFTAEQKEMLAKNLFVVCPTKEEQLYHIYERNQYLKLPSFVTTDSVLQTYHIFFDYSLRLLEYDKLLDPLEQLTDDMLRKSIYIYNNVKDSEVKAAALKNTAYFAVAQKALELKLPANIPKEAAKTAEEEYNKVLAQSGFEESGIFPFKLDYSQYEPRGHYTRNHDFERYFKAMMWYGQAPFPVDKKQQTIQAFLITYALFLNTDRTPDIDLWEKIYDPTTFYVGCSDDLNPYQYADIMLKVYGSQPRPDSFSDKDKYSKVLAEAKKYPQPKIMPDWATEDTPVKQQFRFMGQRYIPDSEILQKLVDKDLRPMPKGLDVAGVLGSSRAYDLLVNKYQEDKKFKDYLPNFLKLKKEYDALETEKWQSNMYYGWLWSLRPLLQSFGNGYPSFMTNQAWDDKNLSTALGSWAELRHDTILYGKQSGAECGGADQEIPIIKSYVEPSVEVYERLLWLTRYSKENLEARDIIPDALADKISNFEDLLQFLINCSVKELKNQELTREEYNQLLVYGGMLENLTLSMADGEILSDTDRNMAVISDVHTVPGNYLEEAVGKASEIFVVVPVNGKLYLTRGAVFDYNEFISGKRLTDEEWQKMLDSGSAPQRPDWTKSFIRGSKEEIPEPATPYFTGC